MDYKEKYENGVNELRNLRNRLMELNVINADGIINANLERIFPELRESEDEKIRRAIINVFATHKGFEVFYGATVNDILSWLKKQGEPKHNWCEGCNNAKGCVACVDGSEWAHIEEHNPAWNEEDEMMLDKLLKHFDWEGNYRFDKNDCDEAQDWLKSIKKQMKGE